MLDDCTLTVRKAARLTGFAAADFSRVRNAAGQAEAVLTALDVLRHCEDDGMEGVLHLPGDALAIRSIVGLFPAKMAEMCRHALCKPERQVGYFRHFSNHDRLQNLSFAIHVLELHGNSMDAPLLRRYTSDPNLGTDAIAALQAIEERLAEKP